MSDKMYPLSFQNLLNWIFQEFETERTIFGIPATHFYFKKNKNQLKIFGEYLDTPLGPAAGPHTQLAQNIISAYLVGGRFMELKTVQILDQLEIDKPCIDTRDEGYNVEWSQELTLDESFEEYLKAWFILHLIEERFRSSPNVNHGFIFNMSIGYSLDGIKTEQMNRFINQMKDASKHFLFDKYRQLLKNQSTINKLTTFLNRLKLTKKQTIDQSLSVIERIQKISPKISNSVTLSTMHGCPPAEIEAICEYLIAEKDLNTYVKLNPTLLGFETVQEILTSLGYYYIKLDRSSFIHDLQYHDVVSMIKRLQNFAKNYNKVFGVKLSNTLGMKNIKKNLKGDYVYMSGRALFPLTIHLAYRLTKEFNGNIAISHSGGASAYNIKEIYGTGIYPITVVTELLKPGGYSRMLQMVQNIDSPNSVSKNKTGKINLKKLEALANNSLKKVYYKKEYREIESIKVSRQLPQYDCYIAPCEVACPIHQDVSEYIHLIEKGKYTEALKVILNKNPLPYITGYICDHQCMFHCTRWDYDMPVLIRDLKRFAAERGYNHCLKNIKKVNSIKLNPPKVAIIGAGPAGLSAAYFLAKSGMDVTVFNKSNKAGGTVQNIIPKFRLPQSAIKKDIKLISAYGVKFEMGVNEFFSLTALKKEGFKYIFIGIGAGKSNKLNLPGNGKRIINAIDFLWDFHVKKVIDLGKNVAVIGGGNSAMDGARAALRCDGVKKVYIIYRRTKEFMPADKEEFYAAINDGVEFKELLLPIEYKDSKLNCQKMMLDKLDSDGRRRVVPKENEFKKFEIDTVISAIGEHVDREILLKNSIKFDKNNRVKINPETNETSIENVYIGGDALRGPSTVVEAIADGKKVAEIIIRKESQQGFLLIDDNKTQNVSKLESDIISRKYNLQFVENKDERKEASRCLLCNLICNKCVDVCPNRANVAVKIDNQYGYYKDKYQILHIDGMCNECGNCETFCPCSGSPYKDKITLFWSEKELLNSIQNGFYLKDKKNEFLTFLIRYFSEIGNLIIQLKDDSFSSTLTRFDNKKDFEKFVRFVIWVFKKYSFLFNLNEDKIIC
jgi:putative selenate reductase